MPTSVDPVGMIADAIKRSGGTEPSDLRKALCATKGFKADTGEITCASPSGVPVRGVCIIGVKNGNIKSWVPGPQNIRRTT